MGADDPVMAGRVDVLVEGQPVGISMDERTRLLERLRIVAAGERIVLKFESAWLTNQVDLDADDLGRLRMSLELWKATALELPDGITRLLDALEKPVPGNNPGGTSTNE
jgi:hypothetical protein